MDSYFNSIFYYLEKEQIIIDKSEFKFQAQSHSNYPSILSLVDTLTFFNIDNIAIRNSYSEINNLPDRFVALLMEDKSNSELYLIERKNSTYSYFKEEKLENISELELENRWNSIVLLINKSEDIIYKTNNKKNFILPIIVFLIFIFLLFQTKTNIKSIMFIFFPVLGVLFSIAALKDLFGTKNKLINTFCNITTSTSCTTIIESKKWKIFTFLNFSDLSIVFFTTQIVGLFTFSLIMDSNSFFIIQDVLLFCSIPVLFLSLYFQKFVEKKWCPICLVIIGVIISELIYLIFTRELQLVLSLNSLLLYGFLFLFISFIWIALKKGLTKLKDLKEFQLKANRFIRNYEVFKNNLLVNTKTEFPDTPIILGNRDSNSVLTLITNPFCGHCKGVHKIIEGILYKYQSKIQIRLIIKSNLEKENEEAVSFYRNLMSIYFEKEENKFLEALNFWFENRNLKNWLNSYQLKNINTIKIDSVYNAHYNWCTTNEFNYTPALFINGYEFPNVYERENLEFFINDIIEDTDLN